MRPWPDCRLLPCKNEDLANARSQTTETRNPSTRRARHSTAHSDLPARAPHATRHTRWSSDEPLYYHTYLGLDRLLTSQKLMSAEGVSAEGVSAKGGGGGSAPTSSSVVAAAVAGGCPHAAALAAKAEAEVAAAACSASGATTSVAEAAAAAEPSQDELDASNRHGAHDEHLFIIIHQAFELWFKQILWELGDARQLLDQESVPERSVGTVIARLNRVVEIMRLLVDQFTILETMTPLGFLEFRDYLFPASGFQSIQWRKIEVSLGLQSEARATYGARDFCSYLREDHVDVLSTFMGQMPSLHDLVGRWLERTPFVSPPPAAGAAEAADGGADGGGSPEKGAPLLGSLWEHYRAGVAASLDADRAFVREQAAEAEAQAEARAAAAGAAGSEADGEAAAAAAARAAKVVKQMEEIDARGASLGMILSPEKFAEARARGEVRFSHKAMQAAMLITLYQDEPVLNQASRLLRAIVDIDELMTIWRSRHALMVHRMIGVKMGTGGSSGFHYLTQAATQHRVFKDLFNLATFLVPRHELPPLPQQLRKRLAFALDAAELGGEAS